MLKRILSHYLLGFSTILVLFLISCSSTVPHRFKVEPVIYKTDFAVYHRLVHVGQDSSILYVDVESNDYNLSIIAYASIEKKIILSEQVKSIQNKKNESYGLRFKIRNPSYYLEIEIEDEENNRFFRDALMADKLNEIEHLHISSLGKAIVKPYLPILSEINIQHPTKEKLWVKYFDKEFKPAAPPFTDKGYRFNPKKEYTAAIEIPNNGTIRLEGKGLYFIQTDTSSNRGFYLNVFDKKYPKIISSRQMVQATRFITKLDEYKAMINANSTKESIEKFWLARSSDEDDAKKLIKEYYTRIQISNRDFTTYKEGWKTDRGMIYIIFGKPESILKTKEKEIWVYDATSKRGSVRFEFKKIVGQVLLIRSDYFKRPWDVEVYEWRKGILND